LRTPLTSLLGYLETLSLKSATLTPQEHQQYLTIALRQGQRSAIFRSSCLSWRAWSTAALNRSASVSRWGADFRRGAEV
jgi:K+-sensing histidine kinase KdpD